MSREFKVYVQDQGGLNLAGTYVGNTPEESVKHRAGIMLETDNVFDQFHWASPIEDNTIIYGPFQVFTPPNPEISVRKVYTEV